MKVFINKNEVVINTTFDDVEFTEGMDNTTIRVVELISGDKSYIYIPVVFFGSKDVMGCVIYGKQSATLFKARQDVKIHKDYNINGMKLKTNSSGVPLFFCEDK